MERRRMEARPKSIRGKAKSTLDIRIYVFLIAIVNTKLMHLLLDYYTNKHKWHKR